MRAAPSAPASRDRTPSTAETRDYRFLTYVFGGGVKTQAHQKFRDEVTPIRVASIRGQLRFWWRACNPSECTTIQQLREKEGEIWGTTGVASKVIVEVTKQPPPPKQVQVFKYNDRDRLVPCPGMREIAYGAFPLQPKDAQRLREDPGVLFDYGLEEFSLRLAYPAAFAAAVREALWAWETFGGLGGRTRRGFGAIAPLAPVRGRQDAAEITVALEELRQRPTIPGLPSLAGARFAVSRQPFPTAKAAWESAIGALQRLRQGAGVGRNPGQSANRPGRSRWPEPNEIRRLTGKSAPRHSNPQVSVQRFPRGAFGMPIVFHFNPGTRDEPDTQGDPAMKPLELRPAAFERFASPLVLRPFPVEGGFRAGAMALNSPPPAAVLLEEKKRHSVRCDLDSAAAAGIPVMTDQTPLPTDPLERFFWELNR